MAWEQSVSYGAKNWFKITKEQRFFSHERPHFLRNTLNQFYLYVQFLYSIHLASIMIYIPTPLPSAPPFPTTVVGV
ncbi:hypothetical protein Cenrod_0248 [Candidatus Symbiobacter mobilis CR]|uniref:Uncharacterized protein n=1 Tax=Candidatus Symbiobacter mobilis CR TaxID=946483 RepID=U5N549_9BURK|nr:hypothetical protein Cenrod_0248 [Candidatus Symbiobacter mobilis CR]